MPDLKLACMAMKRPELFETLIVSLLRNGSEGWHLSVSVEPGPHQNAFAEICQRLCPKGSFEVRVNETVLGVMENPRRSIQNQFDGGAGFVLSLEEDFELAADALSLARWYRDNHKDHWCALNLLAGPCGSEGLLSWPRETELVFESQTFNSIGVGFTRRDWDRLKSCFLPPKSHPRRSSSDMFTHWGWDWAIYGHILQTPGACVIQPVAGRCTHHGATGVHCTPDFQARAFDNLALSSAKMCGASKEYELTEIDNLPPRIAAHVRSQHEASAYLLWLTQKDRRSRFFAFFSRLNAKRKGRK